MAKEIKCKKCGEIYTSNIGVCPRCYTPKSNSGIAKKIILIILIVLIFLLSLICILAVTDSQNTSSDAEETTVITAGYAVESNGLKVSFLEAEDWNSDNAFIAAESGFKFIRAYFIVENSNSSSRYVGSYNFDCYADNKKMNMSLFGDNTIPLGTDISGGRSIEGYIYYEVPVDSNSIEIEYKSDLWSDKTVFKVK